MNTTRIRMTNAEYMAMPDDGKRYELHDGVLVEMPSASMLHNWIIVVLLRTLSALVIDHKLGYAAADGLDYILAPGLILRPDISFMANVFPPFAQYPTKAPDLAVEVISPSNSASEMSYKVNAYLEYGSRLVWIIDPDQKIVSVYQPGADESIIVRVLKIDDTLTGGDILPTFRLPVRELFGA